MAKKGASVEEDLIIKSLKANFSGKNNIEIMIAYERRLSFRR